MGLNFDNIHDAAGFFRNFKNEYNEIIIDNIASDIYRDSETLILKFDIHAIKRSCCRPDVILKETDCSFDVMAPVGINLEAVILQIFPNPGKKFLSRRVQHDK